MAGRVSSAAVRELQTLFRIGAVGRSTDGHLLEQFRDGTEAVAEAAFSALVNRHGPMVLRVCRGVLDDEHDAQDAFQATFLVLVRKAESVRNLASVGSWLYGVAHRVASRAKVDAAKRRAHERRAATMIQEMRESVPDDDGVGGPAGHAALDEEIRRLPEKYRSVVVLCCLEGLTQEQAAEQLGWPSGTVRGRLARARDLLRKRLTRRGATLSASVIGLWVLPRGASASVVPQALLEATVRGALAVAGKSAAGVVPATVATLADSVVSATSHGMLKTTLLLVGIGSLTASAVGFGVNAARERANTAPPPAVVIQALLTPPTVDAVEPATVTPVNDGTPDREPSARAYPLAGIVIDGDLSDWPADMKKYPITASNGQGKPNRERAWQSSEMGTPSWFNVGYSPAEQLIYLAVTVPDAIPVTGHDDSFHTDSVEVFVDGLRTDRQNLGVLQGDWSTILHAETMPALQYVGVPARGRAYGDPRGDNPALMYGNIRATKSRMAWTRSNGLIKYEWAIQAFDRYPDRPTEIAPGKRIGFDIAVLDQNFEKNAPTSDRTPSYTTWAPWRAFKGCDAPSLGDLIFQGTPPAPPPRNP